MTPDLDIAIRALRVALSEEIRLEPIQDGVWAIDSPFTFPDGDTYTMFLSALEGGMGWRLSDLGSTWMRISYENDTDKFKNGTRGKLLEQILTEGGVQESNGQFGIEVPTEDLGRGMFQLAQVLSRVYDLTFLNRERTEATFLDDLQEALRKFIPLNRIYKDYEVPNVSDPENYPVDFRIEGQQGDLYVFAISSSAKARLTTICLQHYLRHKANFESLLVFQDLGAVSKRDLARIANAGGDVLSGLEDAEDLRRKVLKRTGTLG